MKTESYIIGPTLGKGAFGKVKLGWKNEKNNQVQVVVKFVKRNKLFKDHNNEVKIFKEIMSLKQLNHPNIVNLIEVIKKNNYIGIVLQYVSGGELFDYILKNKRIEENFAKKLFSQLVSGVDYMHSKGFVHRDIKLENLLLDKNNNVVIIDFGFVNFIKNKNELMKTCCGSPCYAAPELVLSKNKYLSRKVDIWSLGIVLYAMISGYLPFDDISGNDVDVIKLYKFISKSTLTFSDFVPPLTRDLLKKIIVINPNQRIEMEQIKSHEWLKQYSYFLSLEKSYWDNLSVKNKNKNSNFNLQFDNNTFFNTKNKLNSNTTSLINTSILTGSKKSNLVDSLTTISSIFDTKSYADFKSKNKKLEVSDNNHINSNNALSYTSKNLNNNLVNCSKKNLINDKKRSIESTFVNNKEEHDSYNLISKKNIKQEVNIKKKSKSKNKTIFNNELLKINFNKFMIQKKKNSFKKKKSNNVKTFNPSVDKNQLKNLSSQNINIKEIKSIINSENNVCCKRNKFDMKIKNCLKIFLKKKKNLS